MTTQKKKTKNKTTISAKEFDQRFEAGEDMGDFLDFDQAIVVKRVNVDFPKWMLDQLDREALRLNVSRQAIIKIWLQERLQQNARN